MPFEDTSIHEITEDHLQNLVGVEKERKTIEYKRDPVGGSDGAKRKFLGDISSFANAAGGHLIFGMDEEDGLATKLVGVSVEGDKEILRLEEMIRDGIRPRIMGIESEAVPLSNGSVAIVIRIQKSWNPPHQVVFQKTFRFWGRGSNGKHPLDVDELRSIFSMSETTAERIRNFRVERTARIGANETPVLLKDEPKFAFHLIPLSAFATTPMMNMRRFTENFAEVAAQGRTYTHRYNIDGFVVYQPEKAKADWYAQVFRNGIVERVQCLPITEREGGKRFLAALYVEENLIELCRRLLPIMKAADISPPIVALLTLTDVTGVKLEFWGPRGNLTESVIDRDHIFVPDALIESYSAPIEQTLRDTFDAMWNASGWQGSPSYDHEGNWTGSSS